uniref:Uncharacterized protein n=1 Tax=Corvus moneduloides TaxID=1196302 RepID=A0A8U7M5H0_CORMO
MEISKGQGEGTGLAWRDGEVSAGLNGDVHVSSPACDTCRRSKHLSLPSVYFLRGVPCGLDFEATQCPNPPSYVPRGFSQLTDRMSFLQRVKNLLFDTQNLFLCDFAIEPYSKLASEFLQREVTVLDLLRKGSVWLLRLEFVLDYPRPLMPNIIPIGGVNCAHKELPQVVNAHEFFSPFLFTGSCAAPLHL